MKNKIDNYLKTRGLLAFIIFVFINIAGLLPFENIYIDIFSHFKFQFVLLGGCFFILFLYLAGLSKKFLIWSIIALIFTGINLVGMRDYFGNTQISKGEKTLKIALFNVLTKNSKYNELQQQVNEQKPDIIILQEVDDIWLENIKELKKDYPYFLEHSRLDNFGIALYSKIPLIEPKIEDWTDYEVPVITAEIKLYGEVLKIYGVHTLPPTGSEYFRVRNEMLAKISELSNDSNIEKFILAGDLNTTVYSVSYKKYIKSSNLKDAQTLAKTMKGTWNAKHFPFLRISLEHVLLSPDLGVKSFVLGKDFGSDHLPVFVDLYF